MNGLSLFSGIGGLDLGLERAGITTVGQVEINPWCRRVLAKHWPDVPRHDDVRTATDWWLADGQVSDNCPTRVERPRVDLVFGGFPCQPFSSAGLRRGVADERWGWPWFADVVRALRPSYVLVENVAALLADRDAFGILLGDLAGIGFDADWSVLSACAVGAPHARERVFLVAHAQRQQFGHGRRFQLPTGSDPQRHLRHWEAESEPYRVADGIPRRMDRLRGLGNAVVPQVAEHVGRLIVAADRERVA